MFFIYLDSKYIKSLTYIVEVYFLVIILFASITITTVIHNDFIDNLLIIVNFFIVIELLKILFRKILKSVFEICNP